MNNAVPAAACIIDTDGDNWRSVTAVKIKRLIKKKKIQESL